MNFIYRILGTSKQNVHQQFKRRMLLLEEQQQLALIVYDVREDHPVMGADSMYQKIRPGMGRDRFRTWYHEMGLSIKPRKNWRRTTDSSGVIRFPNYTIDLKLTGVNQLWVSDITYYEMQERFYYITFIMDRYSRKIKGFSASRSLRTEETTIPALLMSMQYLSGAGKTILHSDGGGQYYSKSFLDLTSNRFINSMASTVYENPHAERLNRTIKNDYLYRYNPQTFDQLKRALIKAVFMYNEGKPHDGLGGMTPAQFETMSNKQ